MVPRVRHSTVLSLQHCGNRRAAACIAAGMLWGLLGWGLTASSSDGGRPAVAAIGLEGGCSVALLPAVRRA